MGCTSSKAFKGEGHRLGTGPTKPTAGPPKADARRTTPNPPVTRQQAPKPGNKTSGSGPEGDMRSAAARAAAQRADSVSRAFVPALTNQCEGCTRHSSLGQSLTSSYSKHEEGRTLGIQTLANYPTSCRNKIGSRRYLPSRNGMSDLPCVHGALSCSSRLSLCLIHVQWD